MAFMVCGCPDATETLNEKSKQCARCYGVKSDMLDIGSIVDAEIREQRGFLSRLDENIKRDVTALTELQIQRERINSLIERLTKQREALNTAH